MTPLLRSAAHLWIFCLRYNFNFTNPSLYMAVAAIVVVAVAAVSKVVVVVVFVVVVVVVIFVV